MRIVFQKSSTIQDNFYNNYLPEHSDFVAWFLYVYPFGWRF
ncbi:hypothetical protein LEP1GSC016_3043 [Leptospira borgpetersenii serovar Hardjo-bovis str. Sponselee]|uniref:Uncharacterized protein n=1 Tax=Leptospira borgpetersenii serovar Hardjo-bovis str. Sponselee TaxID=1303729 RepID=M6C1R8_LEPBO|nr:hypothetical protein LEP1GSC016_3043 [Leptospira borgpetersenii serovar Hardjo-bovis str. Sponselee]